VIDDYQQAALAAADWRGLEVTSFPDHVAGTALTDRLAGFPVLVATRERTRFDDELVAALPDLRLLVSTGMGAAHLDLGALRVAGVTVCGTPGSGTSTGELTFALILGLARHLAHEDAGIRAGRFGRTVGTDLAGARLGLIGLGRLGTQVARIGAAFGMDVVAWSAHLDADHAASFGVRAVAFDELLATSDVVSVHTRLSERTRGLIGSGELAAMKRSAYLVNTSRGPIVDQAALVAALHDGSIAGAGLDVFDREPLPAGSPLLTAPNTLLTPHLGYVTANVYREFYGGAVEDIAAWRAGAPIRLLS
jgi:phosphoglycerate dehydrogenase-like enzyme